jgi:hypothetical protein
MVQHNSQGTNENDNEFINSSHTPQEESFPSHLSFDGLQSKPATSLTFHPVFKSESGEIQKFIYRPLIKSSYGLNWLFITPNVYSEGWDEGSILAFWSPTGWK